MEIVKDNIDVAENVMFHQGGDGNVREKFIDVMYEVVKQVAIDEVNLLERFLESVGKVVE